MFDSRATILHVDGDLNYVYTPGELARFPLVQQGIEGVRSGVLGTMERNAELGITFRCSPDPILVAVGCYVAAIQNAPWLSPPLFWVASAVYHWFPALNTLRAPQVPMLVSAVAVGSVFWLAGLPFAGVLAAWFSSSQIASIERQTTRLKRNRLQIQKSRRDKDSFNVS